MFATILNFLSNEKSRLMLSIWTHRLSKLLVVCVVLLILFGVLQPTLFIYGMWYLDIVIKMVSYDLYRHGDVLRQEAELVWGYHQMQKKFMQNICKEKNLPRGQFMWLVSMSSNNVVPGAVAVAYNIKRISCYNKIGAMVTSGVSNKSLSVLTQAGYELFHVESLDCNWLQKKMNIPETNTGIPGTHTRFKAWLLEKYERIIYIDVDFMILTNMDELFTSPGELSAAYCSRPGVVDPCFNAGLTVLRPSAKTYKALLAKWKEVSNVLGCVSDQVVLWYYYGFTGQWNPLPYSYNVRRKLYYPMKAYHFAGYFFTPKPWSLKKPPTKKEAFDFPGPAMKRADMTIVWWQLFYAALDEYKLHEWWQSSRP